VSEGWILLLQHFSNPFFDVLFRFFSFLGSEIFYLLFLSFIYWCLNKKLAIRLGMVIFISMYVNFTLKDVFHLPRPDHPNLRILENPEGESFPSGHAQSVATVSFFLTRNYPKPLFYMIAIAITTLVSLSRVYLGVHYPRDVIVGSLLGLGIAYLFWYLNEKVEKQRLNLSLWWLMLLSLAVGGLLYFFSTGTLSIRVAGSLTGIFCGSLLEKTYVGFQEKVTVRARFFRYLCGVATIVALYILLKQIFPVSHPGLYLRYFILNFWIVFIMPFLFQWTADYSQTTRRIEHERSGKNRKPAG